MPTNFSKITMSQHIYGGTRIKNTQLIQMKNLFTASLYTMLFQSTAMGPAP